MDREAKLEKEKKGVEKEKALKDISEWLFQLEDLQARFRASESKQHSKRKTSNSKVRYPHFQAYYFDRQRNKNKLVSDGYFER